MKTRFSKLLLFAVVTASCGSCRMENSNTFTPLAESPVGQIKKQADLCIQFDGETIWHCS